MRPMLLCLAASHRWRLCPIAFLSSALHAYEFQSVLCSTFFRWLQPSLKGRQRRGPLRKRVLFLRLSNRNSLCSEALAVQFPRIGQSSNLQLSSRTPLCPIRLRYSAIRMLLSFFALLINVLIRQCADICCVSRSRDISSLVSC